MNKITVIPAYGRDYKNQKAVQEDWDAGKDFLICDVSCKWDGKYINNESKDVEIMVRYNKLTKVYFIKETK